MAGAHVIKEAGLGEAPTARPRRAATYADLEAVPERLVAEILDGELVTHPRPAPKHAVASSNLGMTIGPPFDRGRGGPGGWMILDEPELHLGPDVVVPDLAGWRRERLPTLPDTTYFETVPDWICEVISPSTAARDRGLKRRLYSQFGIRFLWLLDPQVEILETFALHDGSWVLTGAFGCADEVVAAPFEAVGFAVSELWPATRQPEADADTPVTEAN